MCSWGLHLVIPSLVPWEMRKGLMRASLSPFIACRGNKKSGALAWRRAGQRAQKCK
jgi:hypothetical protein